MRNVLIPVALALVVGTSGMAFAANTAAPMAKPAANASAATAMSASSTVKSFDLKTHRLTLTNGITYDLPATFKDPGLKIGEKVTVQYTVNGAAHSAVAVNIG